MENNGSTSRVIVGAKTGHKLGEYNARTQSVTDIQGRYADGIPNYDVALNIMCIQWHWNAK